MPDTFHLSHSLSCVRLLLLNKTTKIETKTKHQLLANYTYTSEFWKQFLYTLLAQFVDSSYFRRSRIEMCVGISRFIILIMF